MSSSFEEIAGDLIPPPMRSKSETPRVGLVVPYRATEAQAHPARPEIKFVWAGTAEFHAQADGPHELVEGFISSGGLSTIFGASNTGKSFLALHLASCIARGVPFFGRRVEKGAVIVIALEGAVSVAQRITAFERHHGIPFGPVGIVSSSLTIMDPSGDVEDLVELVNEKASEIGEPIELVIVDTVARAMVGANENAFEDMSRFISAVDRIREETSAHVLVVHHAGKDQARGARGHSSLRAAVDTEIEVTADELTKLCTFTVIKQRDLPSKGETGTARLVQVEVGINQWGGPVTSCVVEEVLGHEAAPKAQRRSKGEAAVLGYLAGQTTGVRRKELVEALEKQGISRASSYRAIKDMVMVGLVLEGVGGLYLPKG